MAKSRGPLGHILRVDQLDFQTCHNPSPLSSLRIVLNHCSASSKPSALSFLVHPRIRFSGLRSPLTFSSSSLSFLGRLTLLLVRMPNCVLESGLQGLRHATYGQPMTTLQNTMYNIYPRIDAWGCRTLEIAGGKGPTRRLLGDDRPELTLVDLPPPSPLPSPPLLERPTTGGLEDFQSGARLRAPPSAGHPCPLLRQIPASPDPKLSVMRLLFDLHPNPLGPYSCCQWDPLCW